MLEERLTILYILDNIKTIESQVNKVQYVLQGLRE